jgi:TatD DNase family protein
MERIFDTHAHYTDSKFCELEGGADALLGSAEFDGAICGVVNVGTNLENSIASIEQAKKYPFMYAAVGIHPSDAQNVCLDCAEVEIMRIRELIGDENTRKSQKIVAIGEIGFDYYWQPVDKARQADFFARQMSLAEELGLPVIIHNRDAHADTLQMIKSFSGVRGVLHSCSMSAEMIKEIVKLGWYVSFSGTVTFKNAERVRDACAAVPLDRLLIETDAPYLAPVPHRGKLNNSIYMQNTAATVAEVHGKTFDEIAALTTKNARALFGIK